MSSVTSEHSGRQLQETETAVVNVFVDLAATGESVDSAQLLGKFETNMDTLNEDGILTVGSIVLATLSPSSVPSSEPSTTPSDSPSAKPSASLTNGRSLNEGADCFVEIHTYFIYRLVQGTVYI